MNLPWLKTKTQIKLLLSTVWGGPIHLWYEFSISFAVYQLLTCKYFRTVAIFMFHVVLCVTSFFEHRNILRVLCTLYCVTFLFENCHQVKIKSLHVHGSNMRIYLENKVFKNESKSENILASATIINGNKLKHSTEGSVWHKQYAQHWTHFSEVKRVMHGETNQ